MVKTRRSNGENGEVDDGNYDVSIVTDEKVTLWNHSFVVQWFGFKALYATLCTNFLSLFPCRYFIVVSARRCMRF